jgi:hypothetical protein
VQVLTYLPILLYAGAIIFVAIRQGKWIYVVEIIAFTVALVSLTTFIYVSAVEKKTLLPRLKVVTVKTNLPKPLFIVTLLHLWYTRKQMLFITKNIFIVDFVGVYVYIRAR